jgi:hypothetical protein
VITQLLLVSRAVYANVKDYLRLHENRFIDKCNEEIAPAIIAGNTILFPSTLFREIWSRSTLVLDHQTSSALRFMVHIPMKIGTRTSDRGLRGRVA